MIDASSLTYDDRGLVTAVVQDDRTGAMLMVAFMNAEAVEATQRTGRVTFWSRSRQELWEKGSTSGNVLRLVDISRDCDGDALLVRAAPEGPTCHTGTISCFGDHPLQGFAGLEALWDVISTRKTDRPEGSYTTRLIDEGPEGPGRKIVEEATEVLLAIKDHAAGDAGDERVAEEAADLIYHLLVALAERDITPAMVISELDRRSGSTSRRG